MNEERHVVVEVRKSDSILCSHRLTNDDLVNVVKLVPVLISHIVVFNERFKLWAAGNSHVESLSCEEAFWIKQVKEVVINEIGEQLVCQTIKRCHLR